MLNGAGTVTLTGANTFTGATTLNGGVVLEVGNGGTSGSIANTASVTGSTAATLWFDNSGSVSFTGPIQGDISVGQVGSGTLVLSGANTFLGGLAVNAGTVLAGAANVFGSGVLGITGVLGLNGYNQSVGNLGGSGVIALGGATLTVSTAQVWGPFSGTISGAGNLIQTGGGTLTLTGANTFSGNTTIQAGVLQLGNGGTTGGIGNTSTVTGSGTLAFDLGNTSTFAPVIDGTINVLQEGSGTTVLSTAETYAGATTINAGTLQVGTGGTAGSIANTSSVTGSGGVLEFDNSGSVGLAAAISGGIGLLQAGPGTLTLTGANTFSGNTTIQAGTLQIGNGGTTGSIANTPTVTGRGTLAFDLDNTSTFTPVIGGSLSVAQTGVATTILTGTDTYTGATTIDNGGLVVVGNGGTSGGIANTSSVSGSTSGTLWFANSGSIAFARPIVGNLSVGQVGTGTLVLSGANTFVGGLAVYSGTVVAGAANVFGSGVLGITGALNLNGYNQSVGNLGSSGVVALGGATLTVNTAQAWGPFSGTISGTGNLVETGGGTLTLTGANSFTGNATIQAGMLQIGNGRTTGGIANTSTVTGSGTQAFDLSNTSTFAPLIDGTLNVVQAGSGTSVLNRAETYTGATTINAGCLRLTGTGSLAATGAVAVNGGTLDLNGTSKTIGDLSGVGGTITLGGGTLTEGTANSSSFSGVISGSGTLLLTGTNQISNVALDAGTLEIGGSGSIGNGSIVFNTGTASLRIDATTAPTDIISRFVAGDTIDLHGISYAPSESLNYTTATGELDIINNGTTVASLFFGAGNTLVNDPFHIAQETGGTGIVVTNDVPCFPRGTLIRTPGGDVPVETLAVGDAVLTLSGAKQPITWIATGCVLVTRGRRCAATPIVVRKGALAPNVPHQNLHITKGHSLFLDGVLIPAEFLVNNRSIEWDDRAQKVTFYHIELPADDVLVANGAAAESYRDNGNRWLFRNANSGWDQPPKPPCAPVLTGGPLVDAIWRRLLERSGWRPGLPLTDDPDLHVLADGNRVDVAWRRNDVVVFRLDRMPAELRVCSRSGAPLELGVARDPRELGVALRRIVLRQGTRFRILEASDPALIAGFHDFEPDLGLRWTDGDGVLPETLGAGFGDGAELVLTLAGTTRYILEGDGARSRLLATAA